MRFYLLFDTNDSIIKTITNSFNAIGDFQCSGIVSSSTFKVYEILKFPPELVFINLDIFGTTCYDILEKLNRAMGIPPNFIGITSCSKKGMWAFKNGFLDVIEKTTNLEIIKVLSHYKIMHIPNKFYCLSYYQDFQYLDINDIAYLKADNYTTEFIMCDGSSFTNFKTLKHTHLQLPYNFQRIHNSYVINSYFVRRIQIGKGAVHLLNFKESIPLSNKYFQNISTVKKILMDKINLRIG